MIPNRTVYSKPQQSGRKHVFFTLGLTLLLWVGSPAISSGALPGDANNDGIISSLDVTEAVGQILGLGTVPGMADCNQDGTVNILDVACTINYVLQGSGDLPHDPSLVAPDLDGTVATTLVSSSEFLYTGANPIQTGVTESTIEARQVAVIRGKLLTLGGEPLMGVNISILGHPEYGMTRTRPDGIFDMVVNGGGALTVNYQKDGYLSAQRQMDVPLRDFVWFPDLVMISLDTKVTSIDLSAPVMQVAQGTAVTDSDGTRQATLLLPEGTTAFIVMPDGSQQPLSTLSVRATEYTVGPNGPRAMPAELPATSGYTYAVEFSVDEALAAGAIDVQFNKPVIHYVENFLGFPIGSAVPTAYYDRQKGQWIPSKNGRVIKLLSVTGGLADMDVDGDDAADAGAILTDLGITDDERSRLAVLYTPGQSLWRVPITHFTPFDCNWPYSPPQDAEKPKQKKPKKKEKEDEFTIECRSIVESENQILGETIPITGTPFSLNYQSDRNTGYQANYSLRIQLTGDAPPSSLRRIDLEIHIAGQFHEASFNPLPNLSHKFVWDGNDAYGRSGQGLQPVTVRIGYVYPAVYQEPANFNQSFALFSGIEMTGSRAREEITFWEEFGDTLGTFVSAFAGLGGWTLDVHHFYDVNGLVLYKGDGQRRTAETLNQLVIDTVTLDETFLNSLPSQKKSQDGSLYVPDDTLHQVLKIMRDGLVTVVAGTGTAGFSGDGGPATAAQLNSPYDVAVSPDGSLYIADAGNFRIRRVGPDGIITTVAGNGTQGFSGDGGAARDAEIGLLWEIMLGSDGGLYLTDWPRIRRIGTDGIITTVAGTGDFSYNGDGIPATQANIDAVSFNVTSNGIIYIADRFNYRIRLVGPDGIIKTVAGTGSGGFSGDGGPATEADLWEPTGVSVGPDGTLYIADSRNYRIRRVGADGMITTIAGNGTLGYSGDGGPATRAEITAGAVKVGSDGTIFIAGDFQDDFPDRIRAVKPQLPGFLAHEIVIPSADGGEIYAFDLQGRHLRTLSGLTGSLLYQFIYDTSGRLLQIEDGDGNVTIIGRDPTFGNPTAIVSPYGQQTTLFISPGDDLLESMTNPSGESYQFSYDLNSTHGDLLTEIIDPKGNTSFFTYDAEGRLIRDQDPAGGFLTLAQSDIPNGEEVTTNTALGRTTTYRMENLPEGGKRRVTTFSDGTKKETVIKTDGTRTTTSTGGTVTALKDNPDPRFGMQTFVNQEKNITTPSGLIYDVTRNRSVNLSNPSNPFSLVSMTDTLTINGRSYTNFFDAGLRKILSTSPEGRTRSLSLDSRGRVIQTQLGNLLSTTFTYDSYGRLISMVQGTGPETRSFGLTYNSQGNPARMTGPLSREIHFEYDTAGRVIRQTLPDSREILYTYDAKGNITSIRPPGRAAHIFNYNEVNLISAYTPPDTGTAQNVSTTYTYNPEKQLVQINRPDGKTIGYTYDTAGRLSSKVLPQGAVTYQYDSSKGHLDNITAPDGETLSLSYDGILLKTSTWGGDVSGSVEWGYDENFLVTSRKVNSGPAINFVYDQDALLKQAGDLVIERDPLTGLITGTTSGKVTDHVDYNGFGELTGYRTAFDGTDIYSIQYQRDNLRRMLTKTEVIGTGSPDTVGYSYDFASRLVGVALNGASVSTYSYDANNNRQSYTSSSGTSTGSYDSQDRLLQYGSTTYSYNANGDLESKTDTALGETTTYQYDVLGNIRSVSLPGGTTIEYVIDGANRRVGKKINGTLVRGYLYKDAWNPIAELDGSNNVINLFIYGSRNNIPDYMMTQSGVFRIIPDHLGSPRIVIDVTTGQVVQRMDYDEFGNVTMDTHPGFQPFGFAGGLYDSETGLVRFGGRDYDPRVGRWTAKDPVLFAGGSTNLYTYAQNDPVNLMDLNGRQYGPGDIDKSWNGPLDFFNEPAPGESEPFDFGNGILEERGRTKDGIDYVRSCENGTCKETIWDNKSKTSGEAEFSLDCEGPNCGNINEQSMEEMEKVDPNDSEPPQVPPSEPSPSETPTPPSSQPPSPAGPSGGACTYNIWRDSSGNVIKVIQVK